MHRQSNKNVIACQAEFSFQGDLHSEKYLDRGGRHRLENPLSSVQLDTQEITFFKTCQPCGFAGEITLSSYEKKGRKHHRAAWARLFLDENVEGAFQIKPLEIKIQLLEEIVKKYLRGQKLKAKDGESDKVKKLEKGAEKLWRKYNRPLTSWPFRSAFRKYMGCGDETHIVKCSKCGGSHQIKKRCKLRFICPECAVEEALRVKHRYLPRIERALLGPKAKIYTCKTEGCGYELKISRGRYRSPCPWCGKRAWEINEQKLMHLILTNRVKDRVWTKAEIDANNRAVNSLRKELYAEPGNGFLFVNEIKNGFNLHNHCLTFGFYRDKREISATWKEVSGGAGEVVRIKAVKVKSGKAKKAAKRVLGYVVGYVKKVDQFDDSEEGRRLAVLWMLAYQGIRSGHSYGIFYKIGKDDPAYAKMPHCCPYCGADRCWLFTDPYRRDWTVREAEMAGIPTWFEAMEVEGRSGRPPPLIERGWVAFPRRNQVVWKRLDKFNPFEDGRPWIPERLRVEGEVSA